MIRRLALLALLLLAAPAQAGEVVTPPPAPNTVCPVCGMFVAKYPEWVATVLYKDGHAHHFDGAKDLFKFLASPKQYVAGHRPDDVATVAVTDYYAVTRIDARDAFYVIGSDVLGPMGHELVPFLTHAEAEEFMKDHSGKEILSFGQVTPEVIHRLDRGRFK
ncbi:nitrous oxide reductase accessory protein NosL [Magnetospirillum sp. UT-4]|uniref:nitrous oxide reductase accessory protein NosL n=1 Tax=Magnetospirillum sp. UT-4 TaxID=2681467 RepID=UPI001380B590|nr:nitrous oxide reductase accessory protein NosL [Magnetospirillum sp. UT-4]CAA7622800.1 NosL protein [Magnetospirillum sp. UT-4]